ncbi:MAG TPA: glutamine-hydrolyzing GMP synthase [Nitrososphaeraceae archaeon]|jgi:GMP synthase (glutamine-hydrolysing)|nr:glutamine-hydrolyzing GMP synthase [Nitrososphaeraceae archaeon]
MDKIIVLDFGSQYSHLICRRIREANVFCEIYPYNLTSEQIKKLSPNGIIFSGGPASVYTKNSPKPDKKIFELGIPILGICYGHQIIVDNFKGKIKRSNTREYGKAILTIDDKSDLFKNFDGSINCWMSHGDTAESIPTGFKVLAHTESSFSAAIGNQEMKFYGIQFHPEVIHTERGFEILKNFSINISKAKPEWNIMNFIESTIENIKKNVGNDKILCAVSGGIDSTTVAVLLNRAVHDNLQCIFVNHGLLRYGEESLVMNLLTKIGLNVIYIDASERFLTKLKGVIDPEEKRKIIGREFINVFQEEVKNEKEQFQWLAQGTLYPDVIESGISVGPASIIKTHHNVGGLPTILNLKVLEPLRYLYKDEVKKVAKILEVPDELLNRHPFPGPGLAVRIIGEITPEKIRISKHASKIVEDELVNSNLYDSVWQAYAAVGDDKAVGVIGDGRLYGNIVIIRVVNSIDAMTADWTKLPYSLMERMSNRITNEVDGVSWVTYAISSKPPSTIEPQ